jgi:hypothetical protein
MLILFSFGHYGKMRGRILFFLRAIEWAKANLPDDRIAANSGSPDPRNGNAIHMGESWNGQAAGKGVESSCSSRSSQSAEKISFDALMKSQLY